MAPMEPMGMPSSEIGYQVWPAFCVFHTPPPTEPKEKVSGWLAWPATAKQRPPRMGPTSRQRKPDSKPGEYGPAGLICWAKMAKPTHAARHSEVRKTSQRRRPTMLLLGGLAGCRPKNPSTTGRGQIETRRARVTGAGGSFRLTEQVMRSGGDADLTVAGHGHE